jgi:hypothetical protein
MTDTRLLQGGLYTVGAGEAASGTFDVTATQAGIYALVSQPAEEVYENQGGIVVVGAAQTANGTYDVTAHMLGVYVLVKGFPDRRDLRAWTFTQDDHDFYGVILGSDITLVYDKLTKQWCQWRSPEYTYWRAADVSSWEGFNLACDMKSGIVWKIDPEGRLDYETTPISSVVTGMAPARMRQVIPVFAAELVVSQGQPAPSLPAGSVGISIRFSDDGNVTFVDAGSVAGEAFGANTLFRWYGLGQFSSPGRIFEITDTGYARRIDSFDISVGGEGE